MSDTKEEARMYADYHHIKDYIDNLEYQELIELISEYDMLTLDELKRIALENWAMISMDS